ncbi:MAG: osmotically inducible protein OsmC [Deltaproteobacteria bacterium RBG_19FT_COMBO_43_11]|nr:MAG: osmotically inducible protein OsmC [Deltaproteobacteria bacterium RBG_16_44_11]OGP89178.1 MAG: osmotically inducible protein OsmC [Deltaproteobacteria bacterium RBG_19FT_COMBO_43_11]
MEMKYNIDFAGNKKVDAHFRGFTLKSDQPVADGGDNTAPAPLEIFLASIGMCAGFYIVSFCQSRSIPTDNISVTQTVVRNDKTHMVEKVIIDINLPPDFPEKYKAAVIKSAQSCSVKKFLDVPPEIQIAAKVQ